MLRREDKQLKQHYYVRNLLTEIRLMNLYQMTRLTKYCRVKFACIIVSHTLDLYYHAHCSIAYLACCADSSGIVILCDSEVKKC